MDCSGPFSLPKIERWKSKLCQGTLNPFSGKEHVLIRNSQCSLWPFWAVRSDSLGVSCPAARQRVDEQLRHTDEQPGLIQAAVCNSLPGPIQDFLQKYHFTAAGQLDFANCLTSGCTGSFSRQKLASLRSRHTPSCLGQNRKACTNRVGKIQNEKGARESNPPPPLTLTLTS